MILKKPPRAGVESNGTTVITPVTSRDPVGFLSNGVSINIVTKLPNKSGQCLGYFQEGCKHCVYCKSQDISLQSLCLSKSCSASKKRGRPSVAEVNGDDYSPGPVSPASPFVAIYPVTNGSAKKSNIKKEK